MHASAYFAALHDRFLAQANPQKAAAMSQYMRNRFSFYGIKSPERKALVKQARRELGDLPLPELRQLIDLIFQDEVKRELQYTVRDLCEPRLRAMEESWIDAFTELIGRCSWWDTVDFLAPALIGKLLLRYPERMTPWAEARIASTDIWHQRSAIIFQLSYKHQTNVDLLFAMIRRRKDSEEFFVQKGAGWALRQYAKIDPVEVAQFVATTDLANLTRREALKHL